MAMLGLNVDEGLIADISIVEKLTSLSDISRLLHETLAKERGLEAELDQLLNRRGELEQGLIELHASSREVRTTPCLCAIVPLARGWYSAA